MTEQQGKDPVRASHTQQRDWLKGLVAQAQLRGFYGKLIITMEEGQVRRVVKEESLLPPR